MMPPEISLFLKTLNFGQILPIYKILWQFISAWWWLPAPFILWKPASYFWLWWRREIWLKTVYRPILLEIKIPKEVLKPIRAMESVMAALHGVVYHPPDWWEKWIDGQLQTSLSFDIVSVGGETHFFIRIHSAYREAVEAAIYSQYPEVEISQVDDYIKYAPQDIPNKDWGLWATDYCLAKPDPYPIKTYPKFETEMEKEEEKRIDPVANLLEGLSKIKPGEQFWIQIRAEPLAEPDKNPTYANFLKEGAAIRDKIAKRPAEAKPKPILQEAAKILITGKPTEEVKEELLIAPELRMTPGEKEIVAGIENKISKPPFLCGLRFIYLGKREVFFTPNFRLGFNFFQCYATANLNALYPWGPALTKIHRSWFLPLNLIWSRRDYLRRRILFRQYRERFNIRFPRTTGDKGIFILNTEELASLYHFPSWEVAPVPGVPRVEAKKGPPPSLPVE
jgi:hypothetical protein